MIIVNGKEIDCVVLNGKVCPMYLNGQLITPDKKQQYITIGHRKYKIVQIGNQLWMAENLDWRFNGLTYRDGSTNNTITSNSTLPQATYYNYDNQTYGLTGNKYGLLYNWYAVNYLSQHLEELNVPDGWHVPTRNEYNILVDEVGYRNVAGKKLKSKPPVFDGTDDYEFSIVPCGYWEYEFKMLSTHCMMWTSDQYNSSQAWSEIAAETFDTITEYYTTSKYSCLTVRLVKNLT